MADPQLEAFVKCKLSGKDLVQAVLLSDGHIYDRSAAQQLLRTSNPKSSFTGEALDPNYIKNDDNYSDYVNNLIRERQSLQSFQVFVKTISNKTIVIFISGNESINSIKGKIQEKENIRPDQQVLIFGGKQLENRCANDYGIHRNCTLQLVSKLHGGS